MERRKSSGGVTSLESFLFVGFSSVFAPLSLRAAVPGTLSLHVFNGCLPNQAFTAGNFSTPHSVRREELHSWLG